MSAPRLFALTTLLALVAARAQPAQAPSSVPGTVSMSGGVLQPMPASEPELQSLGWLLVGMGVIGLWSQRRRA